MRTNKYLIVWFALLHVVTIGPTLLDAQDVELPRVLIIGDSTYSNNTRDLSKVLKGKVEVVYATWQPDEIADTMTTIRLLDRHLGRLDRNGNPVEQDKWPNWDLIHFNVGLGDLIHRVPNLKAFRVMPIHVGGIRNSTGDQYKKNLDALVKAIKLKAPHAKLVWASTTPIRSSKSNVFEMGSEIEYNRIAAEVMKIHDLPINDMYTFVKHLINMEKPAGFGADPFNFDKKQIHMPIVRVIEQMFDLPPMPETEEEKISRETLAKSGS